MKHLLTKSICIPILLLSAASFLCAPGGAGTPAESCAECGELTLEQIAVALGVGEHKLYDATDGSMRTFTVVRERRPAGGHRFEVFEQTAESGAKGFFYQREDIFRTEGKARAETQVAISILASSDGHSDASVFDLFHDNAGSNRFGQWLGAYLKTQEIPVKAPADAPDIVKLQATHPGIRYGRELNRRTVRVVFKDGEAKFKLSNDESRYGYQSGTARDLDGHIVPENWDLAISNGPYDFAGGAHSPSYQGFSELMQSWTIPSLGLKPDWHCTESNDGSSRCRMTTINDQQRED